MMIFRVLSLILLISIVLYCEDYELLCDKEVLKKNIDRNLIIDSCTKAGEYALKIKEFDNASWYYLLVGDWGKNIDEIRPSIKDNYSNIAHSYMLKGEFEKADKLYKQFFYQSAFSIYGLEEDFLLLLKLYPNKRENINRGREIWNKIYKPISKARPLYEKYQKAKREGKFKNAISYLKEVIELQKKYQPNNKIPIADNYFNLGVLYYENYEFRKAIELLSRAEKVYQNNQSKQGVYADLLGWIASSYDELQEYDKAIKYNLASIKIKKDDLSIATNYNNLGLIYQNRGDYSKALIYFKKDFEINSKILDENSSEMGTIYNNLGSIYDSLGNFQKAFEFYNKSLEISILRKEYLSASTIYGNLGLLFEAWGDYNQSLYYLQKDLEIKTRLKQKEESFVTTYNNLCLVYKSMGKYEKAFENCNKSLNINRKIFGDNHLSTSTNYNNLGLLYDEVGDYDKALEYFKKDLKTRQEIFKVEDISIATSYNNLGLTYKTIGEYQLALMYLNKSLNIKRKVLGEKHFSTAITYDNLGLLYQIMGDYTKALENFKKALEINKKVFEKRYSPIVATNYNNLGLFYERVGDYEKALKYFYKDLDIQERVFKKETVQTAKTYNNIASIYKNVEEYSDALKYYKKSLKVFENILGKKHALTATIYNNLGLMYYHLNDRNQSKIFYLKSLKIREEILGVEHPSTATSYNNLGLYYSAEGKKEIALKYLKKDLKINQKILGLNHSSVSTSHYNIGYLYNEIKNYKKAYYHTDQAFKIFLINRDRTFVTLGNRQKQQYQIQKRNNNKMDILLEIANTYLITDNPTDKGSIVINTFTNWLKYKGTLFEYKNLLSMIENNPKIDTKTKENIKELKRLTIRLDNLDNSDIKPKDYNVTKKYIEEKIHNIEVNLSKQNKKFKEQLKLQDIDYRDISSRLKPNQLYIDFAKGGENYYIFTLDSKNHISFEQIDENSSRDIDLNITNFLDINRKIAENINNQKLIINLKPKTQKILSNLYKLLINKDINQSELIISPDGYLNFLPFEALFNGKRYLIENHTIKYISSGREFIRQSKRKYGKNSSKVVVFGSPDYEYGLEEDEKPKDKTKGSLISTLEGINDFESLDSSKEIEIIKQYYSNIEIYTKEKATVENLMKIVSPKILHISTHGFFFNDKTILNPMRRSALALTSANDAMFQSNLRGIATALKLSSMELYGTELVVLSACETGLGTPQNAEGVIGLPKAFIQAGAKNVIMSLWSVSEQQTALLMEKFYTNVANGKDYTLALRDAKLEMIEKHPYYWSAFIISGI